MTNILLVYITCESIEQAKSIGDHLMKNRLCACINIIPNIQSVSFWPPKENKMEHSKEVVLIAKTIESKYQALEQETVKVHSYDNPCIIAIPTAHVSKKYYNWLLEEVK